MKKLILLLLFVSPCLAEGPRYRHKEPEKQLEFENVYQDIRNIPKTSSGTLPSGSTKYIQNTATLQDGSSFYVQYGAVNGIFNVGANKRTVLQENSFGDTVIGGAAGTNLLYINVNGVTRSTYTTTTLTTNLTVLQPNQPCFRVHNATGPVDFTGDSNTYDIGWPTEDYDTGSNFSGGIFQAPVTGKYLFTAKIQLENVLVTHTAQIFTLVTTGQNYLYQMNHALAEPESSLTLTVITNMSSGDTARTVIRVAGGTHTVDMLNDAGANYFMGCLEN